ncbi:MAG: carboxypeptidase regulatory-like domain-containing protein [Bacteroidales bacterium]
MKKTFVKLSTTICGLLIAVLMSAQVTTSSMTGKVIDSDNAVLPGATVVAVHVPSGTTYACITGAKGNFSIQGLRVGGPYKVTISFIGYKDMTYDGIITELGETYVLNVKMIEDAVMLESAIVTVSKTSVFNEKRMGAAENFNSAKINNTTSISRSLYDVAKLNPLAVKTSGGMSFAGANNRYNSFQIDGTVNNDVFGLSGSGTNGGQTGSNPISIEAIEEVQVVIAPFDVRQSGFVGGGINAVTKSGTNSFHGSAYTYYNNQNYYGKTAGIEGEDWTDERTNLDKQSTKIYGFTVGGPIIKDKLFFFANYEGSRESYPTSFVPGAAGSNSQVDANEVDKVVNYLNTNYGTDGGGYGQMNVPTESDNILARIDWNINSRNKLMLRYSYLNASSMKSVGSSKYTAQLAASGYNMINKTHSFVLELNTNIADNMHNVLRAGFTSVRDHREANNSSLSNVTIKNVADIDGGNEATINFGLDNFSAANALDQDVYTIEDNLTWYNGNHTITVGTHNEFFNMANLFIAYNAGSYEYDNMNDFINGADPSSYRYQYSREDITGTDRWMPEWGAGQLGFYAQDEWRVNDDFRLTYGVRMDIPLFFDDPMTNSIFNNSQVAKNNNVATGVLPKSTPLIAPRVGFRWNASENTVLRGGVGIFTGRIPFVWISNEFSNTGMGLAGTKLYNNNMADAKAHGFVPDFNADSQWIDPTATVPTAEVDVIDENFKFPQVFRVNLALEQKLPYGINMTVEGLFSKTFNNILYENLNYDKVGNLDAVHHGGDNRPVYEQVDNNFTEIIKLSNTNKGYNVNATVKLDKTFNMGLNLMAAYTWGKAMSINDGTSSQAYSCWKYNTSYYGDANQEVTASGFDIRHRIIASVSWRKDYAKHFGTEISLFYRGHSGGPYSLATYGYLNGDGRKGNDAAYIPTDNEIDQFYYRDNAEKMHDFLTDNPQVKDYQGTYVPRNGLRKPWEHHLDLHVAENFYLNIANRRYTLQINADIENLTNLLNHEWGLVYTPYDGYTSSPLSYSDKYQNYSFYGPSDMINIADIASRWHAQIGIKFIF